MLNLSQVYDARYFIAHLVYWDLKYKFRRSKIGILWSVLHPLMMTFIIALVFSVVFKLSFSDYSLYVFSGFIVWEYILSTVIASSNSFIKAESYIKQYYLPVIIYPLRESIVTVMLFIISLIALLFWVMLKNPENIIMIILTTPLTLLIMFLLSFLTSIIVSHIHVRYRDYPYIFGIIMQLLWYFSPVFFKESMFLSNEVIHKIFLYNPLTVILSIIREPFLYGRLPELQNYIYIFIMLLILSTIAYIVNKKYQKNIIFYI